jgi:hypothetical protein
MGHEGKAGGMGFGDSNSRDKQQMGSTRINEGVGWSKPKKKIFRRKMTQPGLLGPKPSKESGQSSQGLGPTNSFPYRVIARVPSQQLRQAGESSAMGAARITGENGMTIAGVTSGDQSSGAGVPYLVLKKIVFNTLYTWISVSYSLLFSSFSDFELLFIFFS